MSNYKKLMALTASFGVFALAISVSAADVQIEWENRESYSDLDRFNEPGVSFKQFSNEMERYVDRVADRYLPDGAQLQLRVQNVDLAGEYEPWHVPPFDDVRVMRDIYPPRIEFKYEVSTPDGERLSGSETLSNMTYQYDIGQRFFDDDHFYYEKQLIADWIRTDLRRQLES